jgi:hypothetical protein
MTTSHPLKPDARPAASDTPTLDCGFTFHFAEEYRDRGWSVIPLDGKRPALASWRRFQTRRAGLNELRAWFETGTANIGVVTGAISGLVVVDCDTPEDALFWKTKHPATPLEVVTGRGGRHFYYRFPRDEQATNRAGVLQRKIDIRGEGGYVAAPPSLHPNGQRYRWEETPNYRLDDVPYFQPDWIASATPATGRSARGNVLRPRSYIRSIRAVAGNGGHNQTFRAACTLRDAGLTPEEALCELVTWNRTNAEPPWSVEELLHKVQSAYQAAKPKGGAS